MYNKTIMKFVFSDIRFNQGLRKCFWPWRSLRFIRPTLKCRKKSVAKNVANVANVAKNVAKSEKK